MLTPSGEQVSSPPLKHSPGSCGVAKSEAGHRSREGPGQSADLHGRTCLPSSLHRSAPGLPVGSCVGTTSGETHPPSSPSTASTSVTVQHLPPTVALVIQELICVLLAPVISQLPESTGCDRGPRPVQELASVC